MDVNDETLCTDIHVFDGEGGLVVFVWKPQEPILSDPIRDQIWEIHQRSGRRFI